MNELLQAVTDELAIRNLTAGYTDAINRLDAGMEPACVETCPGDVFHFGDANDPASPYSRFVAKKGDELKPLKPEERTQPRVTYRGHHAPMEAKIPKGRVHDPYSYEIETWTSLEATFPTRLRVQWARAGHPGTNENGEKS